MDRESPTWVEPRPDEVDVDGEQARFVSSMLVVFEGVKDRFSTSTLSILDWGLSFVGITLFTRTAQFAVVIDFLGPGRGGVNSLEFVVCCELVGIGVEAVIRRVVCLSLNSGSCWEEAEGLVVGSGLVVVGSGLVVRLASGPGLLEFRLAAADEDFGILMTFIR